MTDVFSRKIRLLVENETDYVVPNNTITADFEIDTELRGTSNRSPRSVKIYVTFVQKRSYEEVTFEFSLGYSTFLTYFEGPR